MALLAVWSWYFIQSMSSSWTNCETSSTNAFRNFWSGVFLYIPEKSLTKQIPRLKIWNISKIWFVTENFLVFYTYALWARISCIVFARFFEILFPILPDHFRKFWIWSWFRMLPLQLETTFVKFRTHIRFFSHIDVGSTSKFVHTKKKTCQTILFTWYKFYEVIVRLE